MQCPMCEHRWCWMCGLPVDSIFHQGQGGGAICEIIGQSSFGAGSNLCIRILILLGLFVLWPLILVAIVLPASFAGIFILFDRWKVPQRFSAWDWMARFEMPRKCIPTCCSCIIKLFVILIVLPYQIVLYSLTVGLYLAFSLLLTVFWYALLILPSYVSFIVVVIRKQSVWGQQMQGYEPYNN